MNRSAKLLVAIIAIWSSLLSAACDNGSQNANGGGNPNNNVALTPTPKPPPPAACNDTTPPTQRALDVQAAIDAKVDNPQNPQNKLWVEKSAGRFAYRVVVFPAGGDPNPPQALALVVGGSITGTTIFPTLTGIFQPFMAQKCILRVVFVPNVSDVPPADKVGNITALPIGFGWTGCDYPAVACPSGICDPNGQCPGGIGKAEASTTSSAAPASAIPPANANAGPSRTP